MPSYREYVRKGGSSSLGPFRSSSIQPELTEEETVSAAIVVNDLLTGALKIQPTEMLPSPWSPG